MMNRTTACVASLLTGLSCLSPASANPLGDLLSSAGGGVCFARSYDAAHLARDPKQDTRKALLSLIKDSKFDGATMRITLEGKARTSVIVGECGWTARANLDVQGKPLLDTFKGGPGRTMVMHLPDSIATWSTIERRGRAKWAAFGKSDRVFKLERADRDLCKQMDASIAPLK
ncbi:MAG: hypothetical protein J0H32_16730 [Rhizobiales bacterium]|nr:hypothetical protein [Hyphomicrobiales bacterium]